MPAAVVEPTPARDAVPERVDQARAIATVLVAVRPPDAAALSPAPARVRPSIEAPAMPAARPIADAAYWVQVGAFRTDEAAIKVVTALRDEAVSLLQTPGAALLRVLVGPFASRQAAASKLREIRARGLDGFIAELAP
jgi:cell division septation protein DedD